MHSGAIPKSIGCCSGYTAGDPVVAWHRGMPLVMMGRRDGVRIGHSDAVHVVPPLSDVVRRPESACQQQIPISLNVAVRCRSPRRAAKSMGSDSLLSFPWAVGCRPAEGREAYLNEALRQTLRVSDA